jgi:hypothetical protein
MPKWSQAPAVDEEEVRPRWMEAEVIDEGGPRSFMSRKLDEINPEGAQRRAGVRADRQTPEYALEQGRKARDAQAMMAPGPLGAINMALRATESADSGFAGRAAGKAADMQGGFQSGVSDGALFGLDDELVGLVSQEAKDQRRGAKLAAATDTPVTNFAGQVTGGIASPLNKPLMAVAGVKTGATGARSIAQLSREGFRVGGVGGGLYGFGSAEGDFGERLDEAAEGAAWGMVGGAVLGAGAGAVGNKLSTGKFLPGEAGPDVLNMTPEAFSRSGAGRLIQTALRRSDVAPEDVGGAVGDAVRIFQMSGNLGNRPLTFAQALERSLEQKGYAQAAGNVKSIFQQLQASRSGQGMSQSLDDMAGSQEAYIASALDDTLGPSTLAAERARIRGDQRAIGDAQEDAINQARSMRGNEQGTPIIMRAVDRALNDPDPTVTSWMNRAARDMGFMQTGAGPGAKAVQPFQNAATSDPLGFAKQMVRTINEAKRSGQISEVTANLLDEFQFAINAATKSTRGPGGRFGYNRMGSFDEGQQKFRGTYQELEAQTNKLLTIAKDPRKMAEFEEAMANAPAQAKLAARTALKEDIATALRSGSIDEIMPYLGNVKSKGLSDAMIRLLGDDGEKINRVIRDVLDEQNWIKSVDARRLAPADRSSIGRNADVKNIYTANPLTRLSNKTPLMTTLVGDVATGAITGTPALTAAKVIGHITGPSGKSVRQLAQTLALRARQQGTAPPNRGTLSRMPPAASAGAQQAQQGASPAQPSPNVPATLRTSQRAPWSPAVVSQDTPTIVPRVQTGAQRIADRARQKAVDARQRAADAQARKADAETIRQTLIEARQAEADAKIAETQARAAAKVTEAALREVTKAAKARVRAAKSAGATDKKLTAREAAAAAARRDAEEGLDRTLDVERRTKAAARNETEALKTRNEAERIRRGTEDRVDTYTNAQKIEVAKANAAADVDPVQTFEETGHLALTLGNEPVVVLDIGAKSGDDLVKMLSRVEDDLLGMNRDRPDKWSQLTRVLIEQQGSSEYAAKRARIPFLKDKAGNWFAKVDGQRVRLPNDIDNKAKVQRTLVMALGRRALESEVRKGLVPGWRTPAERAQFERLKTGAKIATGGAAAALAAGGAIAGAGEIDKRQQAALAKRISESPELTKIVQRALKATKQYDRRADGRFDADVQIGIAQFQGNHGLGKTSDPGTLDAATLEKLEEMLVFEGKTELADQIRDIRRNKYKPKEN